MQLTQDYGLSMQVEGTAPLCRAMNHVTHITFVWFS